MTTILDSLRRALQEATTAARPFALVSVEELRTLLRAFDETETAPENCEDTIRLLMIALTNCQDQNDCYCRAIARLKDRS